MFRLRQGFFGRERELDELRRLLAEGVPIISLIGPGGVGKTRLLRELVAARPGEAAFFICELDAATTGREVVEAVAAGTEVGPFELRDPALRAALEAVGRSLERRGSIVVILDNAEQVVREVATALEIWRATAPRAQFLIGSRERLLIGDERVVPLEPLPPEPAEAMLAARAQSFRGRPLEASEREVIPSLAARLDHLPLAIELAAARARTLSLTDVARRFDDERLELCATLRETPARHKTLGTAIAWSWRLLGEPERRALAQCSLFADAFSLEDAEGVLDVSPCLPILESLCDKSLLQATVDSGASFKLLACVREHAYMRLDETTGRSGAAARFVEYHVLVGERLAAALRGSDEHAVGEFSRRRANLLEAHRLATATVEAPAMAARAGLALCELLAVGGVIGPTGDLLDSTERAAEEADDEKLLGRALLARGRFLLAQGMNEQAETAFQAALARLSGVPDREVEARCLLGDLHRYGGRIDAAEAELARALEDARRHGLAALEGIALYRLGVVAAESRRRDVAEERARAAREIARRLDNLRLRSQVSMLLGHLALGAGRPTEARGYVSEALAIHRRFGNRRLEAETLSNLLVQIDLEDGNLEEAERTSLAALEVHRRVANLRGESVALANLGIVHFARRDLDRARSRFREATWCAEAPLPHYAAYFRVWLGAVDACAGRIEEAVELIEGGHAALESHAASDFLAVAETLSGFLGLARARALYHRGGEGSQSGAVAQARLAVTFLPDDSIRLSGDAHLAARILRDELSRLPPALQEAALDPDALAVAEDGSWYRPPGGSLVDLSRRPTLRRLFAALLTHLREHPGIPLATGELIRAGWPDEEVGPAVGGPRVRVAIMTLRKLGLRDLVTLGRADGYLLDPRARVVRLGFREGEEP